MSGSDGESEAPPLPPMLAEDAEATLYKYRDFASVPEDHENDPAPAQSNRSLESSIRVQKFPVKLYAILAQKEFSDIITWMPHGRSWKVLKPNLFESLVMPLFFEYSNYHSFNRLVNAWSFRRISSGPDRGSYYHEVSRLNPSNFYVWNFRELTRHFRFFPAVVSPWQTPPPEIHASSAKTHKKLPMKKQDEPDFYKLDKTNPLPELEETQTVNPNVMGLRRQTPPGLGPLNPQVSPHSGGSNGFLGKPIKENLPPLDGLGARNGAMGLNGMRDQVSRDLGGLNAASESAQLFQLQRLRHLQHIQLFQRQIGAASLAGAEDLARIQAEHALGLRGRPGV
eukprot:CAMPEP_0116844412 /NCGR_PEP_ID=MMETSP0418-20121206/12671_1 /TAXON_ID=1158023 /ORGANISM="Astrosyne radiata, Strain 13vi08-1A" /LENGTH=338 /DNA_ID=CAMNT_0004475357 /DNA_START=96 /DNA_END=1113 /DNA_ORIENTATION=+